MTLARLGYTEHSFIHAGRVTQVAGMILDALMFSKRDIELDKVISYTLGRDIITEEDIDAVCITQVTNKIFDMITAIANRQTRKAMDLYEDLLTLKEPSMRILFLIARQFNQIRTV